MRLITLFLALAFSIVARSQNTINQYKYVLVPERFNIFKMENQYGTNSLTRTLLEDAGFTALMANEMLPSDLNNNKCAALTADLIEKKKFLSVGIIVVLKDCQGNIVFKSEEGKSREKEWDKVYAEAIRNAFASINALQYKYDSTTATPVAQQAPATAAPATPAPVAPAQVIPAATPVTVADNNDVLYAQANANGYQLVDTSPKKIMTLLKTSQPDSFIADDGAVKGIVFRRNSEWFFEYYKDDKLVSRKLNIKF